MAEQSKTNHMVAEGNIDIVPAVTVDARGLNCPLPILKARKEMMEMDNGQILQVIATDPTSQDDFPVFATATKNLLLRSESDGDCFVFYLQVGLS